jgi:hypothetical protein
MRALIPSQPGILSAAIALYASAILWAMARGPNTFLAGLLSGVASIALGVWIGLALSVPPPGPGPRDNGAGSP